MTVLDDMQIHKVDEIRAIRTDSPDHLFVTCASFEDRFLGVPRKLLGGIAKKFILFRFTEPNTKREDLIKEMKRIPAVQEYRSAYHEISIEHGRSLEAILQLHSLLSRNPWPSDGIVVTADISTFTKDLLLNFILYFATFQKLNRLRFLYTIPARYASFDEGWLSVGIKSIHLPPLCWNEWSPLKDNLLVIILGFEEMRAWSLIGAFSADVNWLFVTKPGSKPQWDSYCEEYSERLLKEVPAKGEIPALGTQEAIEALSSHITEDLTRTYNVFICPLATKPQVVATLYFALTNPKIRANIITTTVVSHNVPYYSWDIGDTFEFFFPRIQKCGSR